MSTPPGYPTVSPYFIVSDARATLAFLRDLFGGEVLRTHADDEGRVRHAEVRIDDSVVMLADAAPEWPPQPAHAHVYVADVDATYAKALELGAESVQEPVRKDDPDKRGGVKGRGGVTWWIATPGS